jgi:hypothetical protein
LVSEIAKRQLNINEEGAAEDRNTPQILFRKFGEKIPIPGQKVELPNLTGNGTSEANPLVDVVVI